MTADRPLPAAQPGLRAIARTAGPRLIPTHHDRRSDQDHPDQRTAPNRIRSLDRRRSHRSRRLAAGVADDAAERHRRAAGHHRSRDGRPLRRLHRQRRHRRQLADHPRRHRLHQLAVHRDGRARGALCRRQRARQGQPRRLSGVPDGGRPVGAPGRGRLLRRAGAARPGQRRARGAAPRRCRSCARCSWASSA